jgi:Fic-DOC domain mobile mystery protein B
MNFLLDHPLAYGNTPIRAEDLAHLIPKISTLGELNEYEALNILEAQKWAFAARVMGATNPLDERYARLLHERMFGQVWKWAGVYRLHELNVGCDPHEIIQRIPQLLGNTAYQLDHNTFPIDECLIRFHHRLVSTIHPFNNGNGRHARMMTDVLAAKRGRPVFTWGAGTNLATENVGRATYLAALRALDDNENNVKPLIDFARS